MSSPAHGTKIKIKRPAGIADASHTSDVPTGTNLTNHQQPTSGTQPSEADQVCFCLTIIPQLTHSLQDAPVDAASLKTLQVSELQAWIKDNGLSMPKSKRKDGASYSLGSNNANNAHRSHCGDCQVPGIHTDVQLNHLRDCQQGEVLSIFTM